MKRIYVLILVVFFIVSCSKKENIVNPDQLEKDTLLTGWQMKSLGNEMNVWDIAFNGTQTGAAIVRNGSNTYENLLFRTTNGGNEWVRINSFNRVNNSSYPFSFEKCTIRKDGVLFFLSIGTNSSILYSSTSNNILDSTIFPAELYGITFIDNNVGYCSGFKLELGQKKVVLYKTTNGGLNWLDLPIPLIPGANISPMSFSSHFIDTNTGWFAFNSFYTSQSSDLNWIERPISTTTNVTLASISAPNRNTVFVGSLTSEVFKSINGGVSFIKLPLPNYTQRSYTDQYFINDLIGYVVVFNKVFKTTDGGQTWKTEVSLKNGRIHDLFVVDENNCWVGGRNGAMLKLSR